MIPHSGRFDCLYDTLENMTTESLLYHRDLNQDVPVKYREVLNAIGDAKVVLELGCHTGYFLELLRAKGKTVIGLEANPEAVAVATAKGLDVRPFDLEQESAWAAFPQDLDVIVAMDVLEHLRDPSQVLNRLQKYLKPGGKLLVTGPNVGYWAVRKDLLLGRWNYQDAGILDQTHLRFYTFATWQKLIAGSGFSGVKMRGLDIMLPLQQFIPRGLRALLTRLQIWAGRYFPKLFSITVFIEARNPT